MIKRKDINLSPEMALDLINNDEDFVCLKRFDYSLSKLLERYPDGVPDKIIAQALQIPEEYIKTIWEDIVVRLRQKFNLT